MTNVKAANMATKPALNSSRKMVSARHVSMMAEERRSRTRSSSISRSAPKKTLMTKLYRHSAAANDRLPTAATASLDVER